MKYKIASLACFNLLFKPYENYFIFCRRQKVS